MSKRVVVASGYFNPLHYGHVSYLQKAKDEGDCLIVIVNNDRQLAMKSPGPPLFMPARERVKLVRSLACVDCAVEAIDDDLTVCQTLRKLHPDAFANGGQTHASPEEAQVCRELGIQIIDGLGIEVLVLQPFTQHYDWGKPKEESLVAKFSGDEEVMKAEPSKPYAELWMGDHPSGPSSVKNSSHGETSCLRTTLRRSPSMLGEKLKKDGQLPFLLKILSIHKALSIQAHPDKVRAQRLHAERPQVYKDGNHKPEIAIALTDFEALCGFRPVEDLVRFLDHVPEFVAMIGDVEAEGLRKSVGDAKQEEAALKAAFARMMHQPNAFVKEQARALVARVREVSTDDGLHRCLDEAFALVERLNNQFPEDIGIFHVFFLNYAKMHVGDCLYMPQNTPHAYLSGDIVECMACSDNVVRGGLTSKNKDVEVLCEMLNYTGGPAPMIAPKELASGTWLYADAELEEFQVTHMKIPANGKRRTCFSWQGPAIVLCYHGAGSVAMSEETVPLSPGVCFMLAAGVEPEIQAESDLDVFVACCPPQYFNRK
mmetsp:Transcript_51085/g.121369  ORF Transcript_51085/g.121369 Transcript_51085/m.121369 type:complete len:541 (+) Transcript_51085:112-1734(+)